jgi:hypothetical protein
VTDNPDTIVNYTMGLITVVKSFIGQTQEVNLTNSRRYQGSTSVVETRYGTSQGTEDGQEYIKK